MTMVEFRKIKGTPRKEALGMDQLIPLYIRALKLSAGLNTQRVFAAWDAVSGVAGQTLRKFYRDGNLPSMYLTSTYGSRTPSMKGMASSIMILTLSPIALPPD